MKTRPSEVQADLETARERWGPLSPEVLSSFAYLIKEHQLSVSHGDLASLESWLVCYARRPPPARST